MFYVGKLVAEDDTTGELLMQFYRCGPDNRFSLPAKSDETYVTKEDLHTMLPEPTRLSGSRSRGDSGLRFEVELGHDVK